MCAGRRRGRTARGRTGRGRTAPGLRRRSRAPPAHRSPPRGGGPARRRSGAARRPSRPGQRPAPGPLKGNPLYLEQLLVGDRAAASGPEGELPPTLQALLGARIGALARTERAVVDLAAVIGREFAAAELVRLETAVPTEQPGPAPETPATGSGSPDRRRVDEALAALTRRRLVEPRALRGRGFLGVPVQQRAGPRGRLRLALQAGQGGAPRVGGQAAERGADRGRRGRGPPGARLPLPRRTGAAGRPGPAAAGPRRHRAGPGRAHSHARSDLHWAHGLPRAVTMEGNAREARFLHSLGCRGCRWPRSYGSPPSTVTGAWSCAPTPRSPYTRGSRHWNGPMWSRRSRRPGWRS
ncbi:hypothetical protein SMICM304S_07400 [Streptomyces microflavus]